MVQVVQVVQVINVVQVVRVAWVVRVVQVLPSPTPERKIILPQKKLSGIGDTPPPLAKKYAK